MIDGTLAALACLILGMQIKVESLKRLPHRGHFSRPANGLAAAAGILAGCCLPPLGFGASGPGSDCCHAIGRFGTRIRGPLQMRWGIGFDRDLYEYSVGCSGQSGRLLATGAVGLGPRRAPVRLRTLLPVFEQPYPVEEEPAARKCRKIRPFQRLCCGQQGAALIETIGVSGEVAGMRGFLAGWLTGILTLPVLAVGIAWLGFWPTHANASPPGWEKAFAQMALKASAARHAPHLANPIPATDENLLAGMKTFKDACAG